MPSHNKKRSGRSSRGRKRGLIRRVKDFGSDVSQGLSDFGRALVRPIERLASKTTKKVFSASRGVDRVESVFKGFFSSLASVLLWPLRLAGRVLQAILPKSLTRTFTSTGKSIRRFGKRTGKSLLRLVEILNLDQAVLWVGRKTRPIWRPLAALGKFFTTWVGSRKYRRGLNALPAVVLASAVLGVGTWHAVLGKAKTTSKYKTAVREALESQDYESAQLYEQKLAQLGVDTQLTDHRTALSIAGDDRLDEAYERMQLLAPTDEPGYPAAHFWIVQQLLSGKLVEPGDEARALIKVHLDHLEALEVTGPYLQLMQAMWLVQGNRLDEAAEQLKPLTATMAEAAVERLRINLVLKRPQEARQDARTVVTHMSTRMQHGGELGLTDYQWWLAAEEVLGNLQQMRTLLYKQHELEPDDQQVTRAIATVCLRLAAQKLRDPLPDQQKIVALWLEAAEIDQGGQALQQLARTLYEDREPTSVYGRLLAALRESPQTPAGLLAKLGTESAMVERYDDALQFLETAVARDDSDPIAWNNYGLVLAEGENGKLDEALTAVNRALALEPEDHRIRETRGQILLRLERWQESVADLEFALNGLPRLGAIHESLAMAYSALGQEELAQMHKNQVE